MAVLVSKADGNFTAAGTWYTTSAVANAFLDSESNTTVITTSYVACTAATLGAVTIDGIGVKVAAKAGATGTISVELYNSTDAASVKTVTVNITDMYKNGWHFFKFDAAVLLIAAKGYQVRIKTSNASQITMYRNATAGNWSHFFRITTTAAPAAADETIVVGEVFGATLTTTFTVTMDSTSSATSYGRCQINSYAVLDYGTTASTNYYLKVAGDVIIWAGGRLDLSTSTTSTSKLELACTSNVQYGLIGKDDCACWGTGDRGVYVNRTTLSGDVAAGATTLVTAVGTGWKVGDQIAIASTTRTTAESEIRTLTSVSGTTLGFSALTYAHEGTGAYVAEIINLTRAIQIFSTSTTNQAYCSFDDCEVSWTYVELYNMGSTTAGKRGINADPLTWGFQLDSCSFHDFNVANSIGLYVSSASSGSTLGIYITQQVSWNIALNHLKIAATTGTTHTVQNWCAIKSGGDGFSIADLGGTYIDITAVSATGDGISLTGSDARGATISSLIAHSNSAYGINMSTCRTNAGIQTYADFLIWRNLNGILLSAVDNAIFTSPVIHGNQTNNVYFSGTACHNVDILDCTNYGGVSLGTLRGYYLAENACNITVQNSVCGFPYQNNTADVDIITGVIHSNVRFLKFYPYSTVEVLNTDLIGHGVRNGIQFASLDSTGNHIWYHRYGKGQTDTTIYRTTSPSLRLTPQTASYKMKSEDKLAIMNSGQTATVEVYVRCSVVGDGTAYNGGRPRLMKRVDRSIQVGLDVVCATATAAANGAWEKLTYTMSTVSDINGPATFYVDCDGTTGWVNVQSWRTY